MGEAAIGGVIVQALEAGFEPRERGLTTWADVKGRLATCSASI